MQKQPASTLFTDDNPLQIFIESVRSLRKYQKLYARYPIAKNAHHVQDFEVQVDRDLAQVPEAKILFF